MIAIKIVCLEKQEDAAASLIADGASCCGFAAFASSSAAPRVPGGSTTTQRFPLDLSLCDYGDKEKEVDQTWIWGLNYSIRKSSFLKFGGFHPDNISPRYQHFQGDGETGLSLKLKENGAKAWYNPQVIVYHEVPAERMTYFYFEKRYFYQGVCNSFTGIRRIKGSRIRKIIATFVEMSKALARKILRTNAFKLTKNNNVSIEVQLLFARLSEMEKAGYRFHQKIAWSNPQVMEWVLKENYFDYKLPED